MPVTVRRAGAADAEALSRLAALTFPLACTPQTPADVLAAHIATRLDPDTFRRQLGDPACVVLVAESLAVTGGGDLVGYTMLLGGDPGDPDVADVIRLRPTIALERCYVHPDHHGTGVADLLMGQTLAAAAATGAAGAWLGVSEENDRANAFYARHGFEPVGRKRFRIGDRWEDDVVRERSLP